MYVQHGEEIKISALITGFEQIDFILCSPTIAPEITQYGITPVMEVGLSEYRGLSLDIHLTKFLRNTFINTKKN